MRNTKKIYIYFILMVHFCPFYVAKSVEKVPFSWQQDELAALSCYPAYLAVIYGLVWSVHSIAYHRMLVSGKLISIQRYCH